jgi:hypothetical protein
MTHINQFMKDILNIFVYYLYSYKIMCCNNTAAVVVLAIIVRKVLHVALLLLYNYIIMKNNTILRIHCIELNALYKKM